MTDPTQHLWWLASRASGLVALVLVTLSVVLGLAMAGKVARRPGWPRALLAVHEQSSVVALLAIAVHAGTLAGDQWLRPGIAGVTVPFAMSYRPAFTGIGVLAAYLSALLGLSFYARRRLGAKRWRAAHRLTIITYIMVVVHVLGAGTDAGTPWLRGFLAGTIVPIVVLLAVRVRAAGRQAAPRAARASPSAVRTVRSSEM